MDPLESLSLEDDTTLAIIEECLSRNYNIWHFLPKDVSYINGEVMASSKIILEFNRDIQSGFKTSDLIRKNLKLRNGLTSRFYSEEFPEKYRHTEFLISAGHFLKRPDLYGEHGFTDKNLIMLLKMK